MYNILAVLLVSSAFATPLSGIAEGDKILEVMADSMVKVNIVAFTALHLACPSNAMAGI